MKQATSHTGYIRLKQPSYLSVQHSQHDSYGGDQTWFSSPTIRGYGCGLIAAHDLLWYLDSEKIASGFFPDVFRNFSVSWESYESSVRKLHRFFPILPHLGINGLMLSGGLNLFFLLHHLPYRASWQIDFQNTGNKLSDMLHRNIPVILSIGGNFPFFRKKDRLPLYKKNADGTYTQASSARAHYVTVTGIEHGWLRISSWGQEWYINWKEYRVFSLRKSCPLFSNLCLIKEL